MKAYKKLMNGLAVLEKIVMCVILTFVTALTFANVCVRYLSDSQFAWTEELVINLFVLLIMMGCGLCARDGSLISLSLIFDRLSVKGKKVFVAIITVMNTVFWVLLASGKRTFSLGAPEWVFTVFLPIGCIFLILHTFEFCMDVFAGNAACVKEEGND